MTTDNEFLKDVLKDGQWHSHAEILRYSLEERGCGMTVHSRVADLRATGLTVEYRRVKGTRAQAHQYRLVRTGQRESAAGTDGSAALYGPSGPPASRPLEVSSEGPAVSHLGEPPAQLSLAELTEGEMVARGRSETGVDAPAVVRTVPYQGASTTFPSVSSVRAA